MNTKRLRTLGNRLLGRRLAIQLALVLVSLSGVPASLAQLTTTGTIKGAVTDQQGAAVPSASVTITNTGTGVVQKATSDSSGGFSQSGLPNGTYTVEVSSPSFSIHKETGVYLEPAAVFTANIVLMPGAAITTVTVKASRVAVQTVTPKCPAPFPGKKQRNFP